MFENWIGRKVAFCNLMKGFVLGVLDSEASFVCA